MNVGLAELVVIAVVALVVLRPGDIPGLARKTGIFWAQVKMNWDGMKQGWLEGAEQGRKAGGNKKG